MDFCPCEDFASSFSFWRNCEFDETIFRPKVSPDSCFQSERTEDLWAACIVDRNLDGAVNSAKYGALVKHVCLFLLYKICKSCKKLQTLVVYSTIPMQRCKLAAAITDNMTIWHLTNVVLVGHKGHIWAFCWFAAGQKDARLPPSAVLQCSHVNIQTNIYWGFSRASAHTFFPPFSPKRLQWSSESWCRNLCTKNTVWWWCYYCRPLYSNPLLQFSQCRLHLSVSCRPISHRCPCLALLQLYLRTRTNSIRPKKNDSACRRRASTCRVFTSGTWILQVRGSSGGHILGVGARQQRRSLVHAVGGHVADRERSDGRLLAAPGFPSARRSSQRLVVGASCSGPAAAAAATAPLTEAWRGEELRAGPSPLGYGPGYGQWSWCAGLKCAVVAIFFPPIWNTINLKRACKRKYSIFFNLSPKIIISSCIEIRFRDQTRK